MALINTGVGAILLGMALAGAAIAAPANDRMKVCAAQWQGMKAAHTATGTYRDFSKSCLAGSAAAPAPARPRPTQGQPAPTGPAKPSILSRITKRIKEANANANTNTESAPTPANNNVATTGSYRGKSITTDPAGATGQCRDGTYTHAVHHSGACSSHGGVAKWMDGK